MCVDGMLSASMTRTQRAPDFGLRDCPPKTCTAASLLPAVGNICVRVWTKQPQPQRHSCIKRGEPAPAAGVHRHTQKPGVAILLTPTTDRVHNAHIHAVRHLQPTSARRTHTALQADCCKRTAAAPQRALLEQAPLLLCLLTAAWRQQPRQQPPAASCWLLRPAPR